MRIFKNIVGILSIGLGITAVATGLVVTDVQFTLVAVLILGGLNLVN